MFFPNLPLRAFLRNIKSPLFTAKFSLLAFFSFHQYLNYRCSPYYCSENHHHHHDHHHNPHKTLDFKRYLAEKNMERLSDLEIANRPYIAFYYDGIRKSLDCFEKYEVYANPKTVVLNFLFKITKFFWIFQFFFGNFSFIIGRRF